MIKRIITLCGLLMVFFSALFSQNAPDTLWTKTFGGSDYGEAYSVQQTTDLGYIIAGYTSSYGTGSNDVYLIKTNENGDSLWTKTFGGSGNDKSYSVQQTSDGGYIVTGYTSSYGAGQYDVYLIKTNENGDTLWTKSFGGTATDRAFSVQQTTDDGFIIVGDTESSGAGQYDVWLIKTDVNGDSLWTKTFGGSNYDFARSVKQTTDGGYIIVGYTDLYGTGENYILLIKTDMNGNTLWTKTFGGFNNDYRGYSVQQTIDGGYIVAGYSCFIAGFPNVYLIKTDGNGNEEWHKWFGGYFTDKGYSVQQTSDGGYIITGNTYDVINEDVYLIKTDENGDTLWTKTLGGVEGNDCGTSVQQTTDGGYILVGNTWSYGIGFHNIWLIKIDTAITGIDYQVLLKLKSLNLGNYPNPFNSETKIQYSLPYKSNVELKIYNIKGQLVKKFLIDNNQSSIVWNGKNENGKQLSTGIYLYKLSIGNNKSIIKKMVLLR